MLEVTIPLRSNEEAFLVLGPYDRYAKLLRQALDIEVYAKSGNLRLKGGEAAVVEAQRRIEHLLGKARKGRELEPRKIEEILTASPGEDGSREREGSSRARDANGRGGAGASASATRRDRGPRVRSFRVGAFEPRTENQRRYVELIGKRALTFGLGPAGTGKTFLAVGCALRALAEGEVRRLIVTRPVVEAGEHLGFLPGDLQAKVDPYMRPVYDALHALLDPDALARMEEDAIIEVAPLAYMRGRTLSHAFVVLDEGQNTRVTQMKMFLTRLGEGSRMVVTGDPSQVDLERDHRSGLIDAVGRLKSFQEDVGVVEFDKRDIVRHPLVEQIVRAYEAPAPPDGRPDTRGERGEKPEKDAR